MQRCTSSGCLLHKCTWRGCVPYADGSKAITAILRRLCIITSRGRTFRKRKRRLLCRKRKRYWMRGHSFLIAPLPTYTIPTPCRRCLPKRTPPSIQLWISSTGKPPSPTMPLVLRFCLSCMGRRRRDCLRGRDKQKRKKFLLFQGILIPMNIIKQTIMRSICTIVVCFMNSKFFNQRIL